jgi:tetratricopeptide (TPR) repeat protein
MHGDYAETEGKADPRVKHVFTVFQRVRDAADKTASRPPRLFIIRTRGEPYAIALPDGGIIISRQTLDTCYKGASTETGNRRMAFILGHELAHLANNDFIHSEAFQALTRHGSPTDQDEIKSIIKPTKPEQEKAAKGKELMADRMGVLYASMAGYEMSGLFSGEDNFLLQWANQTGIGYLYDRKSGHPSFKKRLPIIRTQLESIAGQVELFRAGVLLYQRGGYEDAAAAFTEFSRAYPAREVFNNAGACYFQLAMQRLQKKFSKVYYKFRFASVIDYSTGAESIPHLRSAAHYLKDPVVSINLDNAWRYFKLAKEKDAYDVNSRCNLAAVLILKQQYARAQAECDDALKIEPGNVNAVNQKAIALYFYGKQVGVDMSQKALQMLSDGFKKAQGRFELLYNLAVLKQDRVRLAGAKQDWEAYLRTAPMDEFYVYVCKKLKKRVPSPALSMGILPMQPKGIRLGEPAVRFETDWGNSRTFKLSKEKGNDWSMNLKVLVKGNLRLIALDGKIEIIEQRLHPRLNAPALINRLGKPRHIVNHAEGSIYVYKDRGFSFNTVQGKVHYYIWYEKDFTAIKTK